MKRYFGIGLLILVHLSALIGQGSAQEDMDLSEITDDMLSDEQRAQLEELEMEVMAMDEDELDPSTKPEGIAELEAELDELDRLLAEVDQTLEEAPEGALSAGREAMAEAATGEAAEMEAETAGEWAPSQATMESENEPNSKYSQANAIAANGTISGTIQPKGDHDWYLIEVSDQGALTIQTEEVGEEIGLLFRAWNDDKEPFTNWIQPPRVGGLTEGVIDFPKGGTYWLEVADDYDSAGSATPYRLSLSYQTTGDEYEPNNRYGSPAEVDLETPVRATIFPKGDADCYAVEVDDQGELAMLITNVPENLDIVMRVMDANHDVMRDWILPGRKGGDTEGYADLPKPGRYWIVLGDRYDDERSPDSYEMRLTFTATGDVHEPNNRFGETAMIEIGETVEATILPKGDQDWYRMEADEGGQLELLITEVPENLDLVCRVLNADKEVVKDWMLPPRKGGDTVGTIDLPGPGSYWVVVGDRYDDERTPESYQLTLSRK